MTTKTRPLTDAEKTYLLKLYREQPDGFGPHIKTQCGFSVRGLIAQNPLRPRSREGHQHVLTDAGRAAAEALVEAEIAAEVKAYRARLVEIGRADLLAENQPAGRR